MRKIFNFCLRRLEYYSTVYENGDSRVLAILLFIVAISSLHFFFFVVFAFTNVPEMCIFNLYAFIACWFCVYFIIIKQKYIVAQYLIIFVMCAYMVVSTYNFGFEKNAYILVFPLIFAIYFVSPENIIHVTSSIIMSVIAYFIMLYCRFNIVSKYQDSVHYIELVNILFAVSSMTFIIYTIGLSEKIIKVMQEDEIKNLEKDAKTDFLTGLYNKRYLEDISEKINRLDNTFLVMADIDYFKRVNDTYGHLTGDMVLKEVSKLMKSSFRNEDVLIRWGGEEFILIIKSTDIDIITMKINAFRELIANKEFRYKNIKFKITITFGIKEIDKNVAFIKNLSDADEALYFGKENGRNRAIFYVSDNQYKDVLI